MKTLKENTQKLEKIKIVLASIEKLYWIQELQKCIQKISVLDKKILNTVFKYFLVNHSCNSLGVKLKIGMTRCSLGCSDFDFFSHFEA